MILDDEMQSRETVLKPGFEAFTAETVIPVDISRAFFSLAS